MGGKTPVACSTMSTRVVTTMMTSKPATTAQMDFLFMILSRNSIPFSISPAAQPGRELVRAFYRRRPLAQPRAAHGVRGERAGLAGPALGGLGEKLPGLGVVALRKSANPERIGVFQAIALGRQPPVSALLLRDAVA